MNLLSKVKLKKIYESNHASPTLQIIIYFHPSHSINVVHLNFVSLSYLIPKFTLALQLCKNDKHEEFNFMFTCISNHYNRKFNTGDLYIFSL